MWVKIKLGELFVMESVNYLLCYIVMLWMFELYIEGKWNYKISFILKVIK